MKIAQNELVSILEKITKATATRPTLPVLAYVGFDGENRRAHCTDLSTWIFAEMPALDFSACVPGRLLLDLVKTMNGMIEIEPREDTLLVSAGRHESTVKTMPFSEMPFLSSEPDGWRDAPDGILASIDKVAFCAARDESRPALTGVLVSNNGTIAAADGFRLATTGAVDGVIVPASALSILPSLFKGEQVQQSTGANQIAFRAGSVMVVSQLIDGKYPQVEQIIPKQYEARLEFTAGEALFALKTVLVLSDDSKIVTVSRNGDKIHLAAHNENGEAESEFYAAGGDFGPFAVNGAYLRDAMAAMVKIEMRINTPSSPILLVEEEYRHVIMPMQVRK